MYIFCQNVNSQLEQQTKLADLYREQVLDLEEQLSRIREEGDVTREAFKVCKHTYHYPTLETFTHTIITTFLQLHYEH